MDTKTFAIITDIHSNLESLNQALKDGVKFEELASKHSHDNSSKTRGGIIGWVTINQFKSVFFRLPSCSC